MPRSPAPLRIIPRLQRLTHRIGVWFDQVRDELGIGQAEAHILAYLQHHSPCTIAEIHDDFGHRRSTLTGILDRLADRALVERIINPDNRRTTMVLLTQAGRILAGRVADRLTRLEAEVAREAGPSAVEGFLLLSEGFGKVLDRESQAPD